MQTFLPYANFYESANCLDKKRCWKQVVETAQIIKILEEATDEIAWSKHPAIKMWVGHIDCLKMYFNTFLEVCIEKHGIKTKYNYYQFSEEQVENISEPWWLGKKKFHRAMRARLIDKFPEFYEPIFPEEDKGYNDGKYFWPDMETQTFKVIESK